jgi:hypothetical protein
VQLKVTDPTYLPPERPGPLDAAILRLLLDPRDLPLVHLILKFSVLVHPFALYLYWKRDFSPWLGALYYFVAMGIFFGPAVLMHHNSSHRPLLRPGHAWLSRLIQWGICPFVGLTPGTYYAHHIGMHHAENNLPDDLSSTMVYRRDSFFDFLRYAGSFYLSGIPRLLAYFRDRKRWKLYRKVWLGELAYYLALAALLALDWRATLVVFVLPLVGARFNLMMGNWTQHAFVDPSDPGNPYRNSTTCINTFYNRVCFNDGYHIGHHVKATRHWSEMPGDFERNRESYAREGAVVFDGIDYVAVWLNLMLKRYDWLAGKLARLDDTPREALVARLRQRTRPIA